MVIYILLWMLDPGARRRGTIGKNIRMWTAHYAYFTFCLRIHTHSETAHNAGCRCASYVLNLADSK